MVVVVVVVVGVVVRWCRWRVWTEHRGARWSHTVPTTEHDHARSRTHAHRQRVRTGTCAHKGARSPVWIVCPVCRHR